MNAGETRAMLHDIQDEAVTAGKEYAEENDEEPDADDLIQQIVETGCFGDPSACGYSPDQELVVKDPEAEQ